MCNIFCTLFSHHHWHNAKLNNGLFMYALYVCTRHKRVFLRLNIKRCGNLSDHMTLSGQFKQLASLSCTSWFFQTIMKPLNLLRYIHTHFTHKRRRFLWILWILSLSRSRFLSVKLYWDPAKANVKEKIFFEICHLFFDLFRYRLVWIGLLIFSACSLIFFAFA